MSTLCSAIGGGLVLVTAATVVFMLLLLVVTGTTVVAGATVKFIRSKLLRVLRKYKRE